MRIVQDDIRPSRPKIAVVQRALVPDASLETGPLRAPVVGGALDEATLVRAIESGERACFLDVLVTRELALVCMRYNTSGVTNRNLKLRSVERYEAAARQNRWRNTGEPVIFSNQKMMNDGQNRLTAIINTGIPLVMDIRIGISRDAFSVTNTGGKRSGADALTIVGSKAGIPTVSAVARLTLAYEEGLPRAAHRGFANDEIVRAVERWPDIPETMRYASSLPAGMRNASMHTLGFFASRTANESTVQEFFKVLKTGAGNPDNPPHRLHQALLRHRGGQDTNTRVHFLALGILAWNAYRDRDGRPMKRLAWNSTSDFPKVDGLKL